VEAGRNLIVLPLPAKDGDICSYLTLAALLFNLLALAGDVCHVQLSINLHHGTGIVGNIGAGHS
jgi:hypothetical protein